MFSALLSACTRVAVVRGVGGVPGVVGMWEGAWEGYTGTQALPSQDPYSSHIPASGPTYGQMKENLRYSMRFPRMGLELTSD